MTITINDIAEIGSGLVISRKKTFSKKDVVKSYKQLNLRAINKNGYIIESELEDFDAKEIIDEYYLTHNGDIVIRLTDPFTAVYIDKDMEEIVISSNFCVIRCKENYSSEFLTYYLNSDKAKKDLFSKLQGSIMKNINMTTIAELEIPNISYNKQVKIENLLLAQTKKLIMLDKIKELEIKKQKAIFDKINK